MAFDPWLYVALFAGFVAGRVVRARSPWTARAAWVAVGVIVFLLGASLASLPASALLATLPLSFALAALLVVFTLVAFVALRGRRPSGAPTSPSIPPRFPVAPLLILALIAGYFTLGRYAVSTGAYVDVGLYALVALVAFDLNITATGLRRVWLPLLAAVVGAIGVALVATVVLEMGAAAAFSTTFAFGWYSLAGPLVATQLGASLGLVAFLTNFLREDLTIVFAPWIGRYFRGGGVAAVGGATSMDTTLPFSVAYDEATGGTLALGTGLILTLSASLAVPLLLSLR